MLYHFRFFLHQTTNGRRPEVVAVTAGNADVSLQVNLAEERVAQLGGYCCSLPKIDARTCS